MICPNGSSRTFGKFIGGRPGSRVDGSEGEKRSCLDSWEMLWTEDNALVATIMMLREEFYRPRRAKMPAPMMATPIDILRQG